MRYILYFFIFFFPLVVKAQISGIILEEHNHTLPSATILLLPDSIQTVANIDGRFSFENLVPGNYELRTSYLGYTTDTTYVDLINNTSKKLTLILNHDHEMIETIIVHEEHAKQELTLQTEHIHTDFFQKNFEGTFAQTIEKLPGISSINVGVGIAKPVIRGLSSNRIIVNH